MLDASVIPRMPIINIYGLLHNMPKKNERPGAQGRKTRRNAAKAKLEPEHRAAAFLIAVEDVYSVGFLSANRSKREQGLSIKYRNAECTGKPLALPVAP
jgi:hypothetical protein